MLLENFKRTVNKITKEQLKITSLTQRLFKKLSLDEKCSNTKFFLVRIFLYSEWIRRFTLFTPYWVWIQENTDQKKLRIWILFTQCISWYRDYYPRSLIQRLFKERAKLQLKCTIKWKSFPVYWTLKVPVRC